MHDDARSDAAVAPDRPRYSDWANRVGNDTVTTADPFEGKFDVFESEKFDVEIEWPEDR